MPERVAEQHIAASATSPEPERSKPFTIVHSTSAAVKTPDVLAIVCLDGGGVVNARLVDIEPDPAQLRAHLPVELTTWVVGTDADGTDAVTFGFQPKKEGCP
jgi:hypothetical protein